MKEYSDQEIVECLRNRQSYVVQYLFERYLPMIRLMVYEKGGTFEDARDVFQDALLIMLQKIDNNEFVLTCRFKTFLYCISENLWKTVLEKRQYAANYFSRKVNDDNDHDFTEINDNKLYENMFYDMFDTLDPLCKKILRAYWEEQSPKDIAIKLGYEYSYVRKKKCECHAELVYKVKSHPVFLSLKKERELVETTVIDY